MGIGAKVSSLSFVCSPAVVDVTLFIKSALVKEGGRAEIHRVYHRACRGPLRRIASAIQETSGRGGLPAGINTAASTSGARADGDACGGTWTKGKKVRRNSLWRIDSGQNVYLGLLRQARPRLLGRVVFCLLRCVQRAIYPLNKL